MLMGILGFVIIACAETVGDYFGFGGICKKGALGMELLKTAHDGTKYLGNNAFEKCYRLSNILIENCQSIGSNAFNGCSSLTSIQALNCTKLDSNSLNAIGEPDLSGKYNYKIIFNVQA